MGTLERLRDVLRNENRGADVLNECLAAWVIAGCPGYESEKVGTIQGLEVKHRARVVTVMTEVGNPIIQLEPGGGLYELTRDDGKPIMVPIYIRPDEPPK